jgi:hypothetical protein
MSTLFVQHPSPDQVYDPIFEFWIPGVLLNGVGLLGLVGNTVSIFVLSRYSSNSSIKTIISRPRVQQNQLASPKLAVIGNRNTEQ